MQKHRIYTAEQYDIMWVESSLIQGIPPRYIGKELARNLDAFQSNQIVSLRASWFVNRKLQEIGALGDPIALPGDGCSVKTACFFL